MLRRSQPSHRKLWPRSDTPLDAIRSLEEEFSNAEAVFSEWTGAPKRDLEEDFPAFRAIAVTEYAGRRSRMDHFDADLFGEPAWDILLDLFIQRLSGRQVSKSSACIASAAPNTTALRWLTLLEEHGLIATKASKTDRRRSYVHLTDKGFNAMLEWCALRQRQLHRMEVEKSAPSAFKWEMT
jgi:hypothetical protein